MCRDPSIHTRTIVTCNRDTVFGFEAWNDAFQLKVGMGGLEDDGASGSSVHVHMYNASIVLPRLRDVLRIGQEALDGVAQHPSPQMVRWPPRPETGKRHQQS
jgi:hypothetical protein